MAIECVNFKPCNSGGSEQHNRRTQDYVHALLMAGLEVYYRDDLTEQNETFVYSATEDKTLQQLHQEAIQRYIDKVGQPPQKDRKRKNPKTGRMETRNGFVPLKEAVVLITPETTMEDLQKLAQIYKDAFKINPLQIFTHKDEGHWEDVDGKQVWKPNLHAHIVFDWTDHETGKTLKLGKAEMRRMQDIAAEVLGMERGQSKEETKAEHIPSKSYGRVAEKEKKKLNQATSTKVKKGVANAIEGIGETLSSLGQGAAKAVGKGKLAEREAKVAERERKANETIKNINQYVETTLPQQIAKERADLEAKYQAKDKRLEQEYGQRVEAAVAQRTAQLEENTERTEERITRQLEERLPTIMKEGGQWGLTYSQAIELAVHGRTQVESVTDPTTGKVFSIVNLGGQHEPVQLRWNKRIEAKIALDWYAFKEFCRAAIHHAWIAINGIANRRGRGPRI